MNLLKTCLAASLGFLLGAVLYHPRPVRAGIGGSVYVEKAGTRQHTIIPIGETVIGFSCASVGEQVECYIATH